MGGRTAHFRLTWGCSMKSYKPFLFLILVASVALGSCSGLPKGNGGGSGTADVSFVLVADTPPSTLGLVSFKVVPTSIVLTPTTGTATTLSINSGNGYTFDLVRLQSDSGYLGTVTKVPTGAYTSIAVTFSSATLAFYNGTGVALTNPVCPSTDVCIATFAGPFTATITTSQTISANGGFGIDVNLSNALTLSGAALTLNLANSSSTAVVSDYTLPRANSNLASGQLDLIEDFTGVVTLSSAGVTITPPSAVNLPSITAATSSSTNYDPDPTGTICPTGTTQLSSCVASNQAASMDAILNTGGTFTVQEIEPLLATPVVDTVEGTVVAINTNSLTQFTMVTTNLIPAASNSLIGSLGTGALLTVNVAANPNPFLIDSKGLPVASQFASSYGSFANATNTTALHAGQTVAVQVTALTAANGTIPASCAVNTVTLRWSRFSATVNTASSPAFTFTAIPGYFLFTPGSTFQVQTFTGTEGADGVTNLDGITSTANLTQGNSAGVRALFIEDPANDLNPAFFAAKVRQQ